jgi:cyclohexa-1,5-dienecarbonyl-CoA hydratase
MKAKSPGTVTVTRIAGRATVTWEHGPANVFDTALLEEFIQALHREEVTGAHVVVLRGEGKCWSGGLSVEDHLQPRVSAMFDAFRTTLRTVWNLPPPTIAQVHGRCLGGGMELLMACDLAVASAGATFGQPEIRLGVFAPFGAATYSHLLGSRQAAELLFLGTPFDARQAAAAGIVNRVVPEDELDASVALTAQTVCSYRREALRLLKRVLRATKTDPWSRMAVAEKAYLDDLMAREDAEEGLRAFLEKRTPIWRDG